MHGVCGGWVRRIQSDARAMPGDGDCMHVRTQRMRRLVLAWMHTHVPLRTLDIDHGCLILVITLKALQTINPLRASIEVTHCQHMTQDGASRNNGYRVYRTLSAKILIGSCLQPPNVRNENANHRNSCLHFERCYRIKTQPEISSILSSRYFRRFACMDLQTRTQLLLKSFEIRLS